MILAALAPLPLVESISARFDDLIEKVSDFTIASRRWAALRRNPVRRNARRLLRSGHSYDAFFSIAARPDIVLLALSRASQLCR
jgi:hypothetical protein